MSIHDKIMAMPTIGVNDNFNGVEIKQIEYGIEDYIICVSNSMCTRPRTHRVKLYYGDRPYFNLRGVRIYLDECVRVQK